MSETKLIKKYEPFILGKCACGCGSDINIRTKRGYLARYKNGHSKPKAEYHCNKCKDQSWIISCACNQCNETIPLRDRHYVVRQFYEGHAIRTRDQIGEKNTNFKGYEIEHKVHKYKLIRMPDHPYNQNGYVPKHRAIMEHYLKILFDEDVYIPSSHDVHHIDKDKHNNTFINLQLVSATEHAVIHNLIDMSDRFCSNDPSHETYIDKRNGRPEWFSNGEGGWLCKKCYYKWKKY